MRYDCIGKFIIDGTPCAVKAARTVWTGGKSGDNFKGLPIRILILPQLFWIVKSLTNVSKQ